MEMGASSYVDEQMGREGGREGRREGGKPSQRIGGGLVERRMGERLWK